MNLMEQFAKYFNQMSVPPGEANQQQPVGEDMEAGYTLAEWCEAREIDLDEFGIVAESIQAKVVDDWATTNMGDMELAKQIPLTVSFHMFALGYEYARNRYSNEIGK